MGGKLLETRAILRSSLAARIVAKSGLRTCDPNQSGLRTLGPLVVPVLVSRLPPVSFYRFKDTGGSRDTHETDTVEPHKGKPTATNLKTNPSPHPPDSRARPHPNPGTHASPHTTPLTDQARLW